MADAQGLQKPVLTWTLAVLVLCAVAAGALSTVVPTPPGALLAFVAKLALLCVVGPLIFAWSWGPQPLSPPALAAAVAVPALSLLLLGVAVKTQRRFLLGISALLWSGFGAVSAYLAVIGTI